MLVRNYKGKLVRMKLDNYTTDKEFYKDYIKKIYNKNLDKKDYNKSILNMISKKNEEDLLS
tara:strand:+ start:685 stop:867 length:183 start_codon:yes stop_codon:yes gene_type:complete